jgi:hypothetical protein
MEMLPRIAGSDATRSLAPNAYDHFINGEWIEGDNGENNALEKALNSGDSIRRSFQAIMICLPSCNPPML